MKLKSKPSARIKKRYLLLEGSKEDIEKAIVDYIGILGYAKAAPQFVSAKGTEQGNLILSIERKELENVRASFELFGNIKIKRVSGTLKGLDK